MSAPSSLSILRRRAEIIAAIRRFFDARGYLAAETPRLAATPIPESHLELFRTKLSGPEGAPADQALYLLPSPEYYLKQLIARGSGDIYEIARSFRNGEVDSPHHSVEFTMLEYYTMDADGAQSLTLTQELLRELGISDDGLVISMQEAWHRWAGIDLAATVDGAAGDRAALARAIGAAGLGTAIGPADTWEDLFHRVFLTYIEPELPRNRPVYVTDYPAAIPTLARRIPGSPWADRWELYLHGVETANCYGEETDPARIAAFFAREREGKRRARRTEHPVHRDYLRNPPLPACSGVALGVDRLVMVLTGATNIDQVVAFRPEIRYDTGFEYETLKGTETR